MLNPIKNKITSALLLTSLSSAPVLASQTLDPVVVTATRTAQTADLSLSPVVVINREEIEANPANDLAYLLRMHAGIEIGRNGGPGQTTSIFIRGTESNHVLMMIDGVKINPGTIGGPQVQNIRLDMVERIEIVKGPRSTLYGSDAIGGVINIITRKAKSGSQNEVSYTKGSYATDSLAIVSNHKIGKTQFGITANEEDSRGFSTRTTSSVDRGYSNTSVQAHLKQQIGKTRIGLSHWHSSGVSDYLDFFLIPVDQDYLNRVSNLTIDSQLSAKWTSKLKLSRMEDKIDQNQSSDFTHTRRDVLDWQNDIQVSNNGLLSAGIYLANEDAASSVFGSGFDVTTDIRAIFAQHDWQKGAHQLLTGIRVTDHEAFDTHTNWNLEYGYTWSKNLKLIFASNSGFHAADSSDRFGFGGNPNLLPEESENLELGLRYKRGKHQLASQIFHNKIDNLIVYNLGTSMLENLESARIKGVELSYSYITRHLTVKAESVFQDPENLDNGNSLARRARRNVSLSINYRQPKYNVGAQVLNASERRDSDFSSTINKGYTLTNLHGIYKITKNLSFKGRIENLFDKQYEIAAGFRTPERSFYLGMTYSF